MFEGWAADVLASYLGKYLDLPRDKLRISLWGGEGILEDVQLRVEAFEYLQLPFAIKEGSVGRLKLQIPWGRWRGGPLVVELSDVVLCVTPREESDWEEGPALRRAQAAKQAQLAAAELAKLGSRVAATGSSNGSKAAQQAATTAGGGGAGWAWLIADYVLSFLLNRLQVAVKNTHVYFQAPEHSRCEYEAFGVKLDSLSTVAAGDTPSVLQLFPALQSASAAASAAAKVIRQLHVQGWSCYWKPSRPQQQQQERHQHDQQQQQHGVAQGASQQASAGGSSQHRRQRQRPRHPAPRVESQDYLLAPVEAVLQVAVHSGAAGTAAAAAAAGGSSSTSSSSAAASTTLLTSGLACDAFVGAGQVSMQLSSQQLVGMARLADDASIWGKRAKYGCHRPPGWITMQQAILMGFSWRQCWQDSGRTQQQQQQAENLGMFQTPPRARQLTRTGSNSSVCSNGSLDGDLAAEEEGLRSSSFCSVGGACVVPTGRNGIGAPVTWRSVWQYAVRSVLADLRDRRRQQGCRSAHRSDLLARRRYVHLYQQRLDALQPHVSAAPADGTADSTGASTAEGGTPGPGPAVGAAAAATDSSMGESSAALQLELQRLEQHLCVEDILLCRSLAELALERRSSSSDAERCRSWFAWGASSITSYLYPSTQHASSASTTTPSKAAPSKQTLGSAAGATATMPSEADLDELLGLLHLRNSDAGTAAPGLSAAAASEDAAAVLEAAQQAAGSQAAPSSSKQSGLATSAVIGLNWQVLGLRAALQDCPADKPKRELLVLDIEGTSITGKLSSGGISAQLALQDVRLFDCCSDPGVHECVLQRLDAASPVAAVGGQLLSPSRAWGSGLTGLSLSQAQGLQRLSPEAFGWAGHSMAAVASGGHMRRAGAGPTGVSGSSSMGSGSLPALFTVGVQLQGEQKHVSVQLQPLQVLARPGCVVAVNSMLQQLPQDTLQHHLAAAAAAVAHADTHGTVAAAGAAADSRPSRDAESTAQTSGTATGSAGGRSVRFSDATGTPQKQGLAEQGGTQAKKQPHQLPPALLQLQLTFHVHELLLVLPTELQYAAGTNAVVHLQSLKLAAAQAPAAAAAAVSSASQPVGLIEPLQYVLSSSSGSSDEGSAGVRAPSRSHRQQQQQLQQLQQQKQFTLGLSSLFVGVQTPASEPQSPKASGTQHHDIMQMQQPKLTELLKLPPVQGTVWLAETPSLPQSPSPRKRAAAHSADGSQQALLKVSLQVPPVCCCLTATLLSTVQQVLTALKWQAQLELAQLVATYNLALQRQLDMAATSAQQQQQQQRGASAATASAPDGGLADSNGDAHAGAGDIRTPSPTDSEVAEWLAAPVSTPPLVMHPIAATAAAAGDAATEGHKAPQHRRCDSDMLLQPGPARGSINAEQPAVSRQQLGTAPRKQQQKKLTASDAAVLLATPRVHLLDLEVLLEELDIQYIHDVAVESCSTPQQQQQGLQELGMPQSPPAPSSGHAPSPPSAAAEFHVRLQASLVSVGFKHSTHGSRAEVGLKDLVLQDMLPDGHQVQQAGLTAAAAAAAAAAGTQGQQAGTAAAAGGGEVGVAAKGSPVVSVLWLISSVALEELQVSWVSQLSQSAAVAELQVALEGLQIQGQPGDVGLFLLPASADASTSITAAVRTATPHLDDSSTAMSHTPATTVAVELHNLALGVDGLVHIAAAVTRPGHSSSNSSSTTKSSNSSVASPATSAEQHHHHHQQQQCQPHGRHESDQKPTLELEVQLSQCQLLSCSSAADVVDGYSTRWQTADGLTPAWSHLHAAAAAAATDQGVVCDLLVDLPAVNFSLQPHKRQQQQCMPAAQQAAQPGLAPHLMLQDVAVYLPGTPQADMLQPVLHIPRVLLSDSLQQHQRQDEQQQPGFAAVLEQQAECHRLLVPAVASSWRPPQLQHLMEFIGRQERQWQSWAAGLQQQQQADEAPLRMESDAQGQTEHDQAHASEAAQLSQGAGESEPGPAHSSQPAQQFSVDVGDIQLLLLPADGTSDKGMLLHWQQLQAVVLKHSQQPQGPHLQQQQQQQGSATQGQQTAAASKLVLQQTQVSWQGLTVSAIQQDDLQSDRQHLDSTGLPGAAAAAAAGDIYAAQLLQQGMATEGAQQLPSELQARLHGGVFFAAQLPAVAWLSQGLGHSRDPQQQQRRRQSGYAGIGAVGPGASQALAGAGSAPLATHASLSRFLSTQESWREASSLVSSIEGSGFFTPRATGSLQSSNSWRTARSSSLSAALSMQLSQRQQQAGQQRAPAGVVPDPAAAAAAAVGPGSNIIAAWWQSDLPGHSPAGASPSWLQTARSYSAAALGFGSVQQSGTGAAAANPAGSIPDPLQYQQQHFEGPQHASLRESGRSPPARRGSVRRSSSFKRGIPLNGLQFGRQQGSISLKSSHVGLAGSNAAASGHSQVHDDGLTDADVEFYSIAGDSEDHDDALSGFSSPRSVRHHGDASSANALDGDDDESWLHGWQLLPLAGFSGQGCQAAASWLLLSLSSAGSIGSMQQGALAAAVQHRQHPALQLELLRDHTTQSTSAPASTAAAALCQVTTVSTSGLQLQLSSRHWDLVAACVLQAVNAASRPKSAAQPLKQPLPQQLASQQQMQSQVQQQACLSQLRIELQELHVVLFVPPAASEPVTQPRTLFMRSSRCGIRGQGQQQLDPSTGGGYRPWQDPGSEPTTPTTAAAGGTALGMTPAHTAAGVAGAGRQTGSSAAQTVSLRLSLAADVSLPCAGKAASLQQVYVPAASVTLGAAPFDASTGTVCMDPASALAHQEQLLLLLARDIHVSSSSSSGGAAQDSLSHATSSSAAAAGAAHSTGQHLSVGISSISGWVSTTRLTLLLNLQQHMLQQLPALIAAAAMAGPALYTGAQVPPPPATAAARVPSRGLSKADSAALTTSFGAAANGYSTASSSSMHRRGPEQPSTEAQLAVDSSIDVAVQKVAVLVSTDEPEPWLLQQQQHSAASRDSSCTSSPDRFPAPASLHTAHSSSSALSPGAGQSSRLATSGYTPLSTCSTPLLELALLPLNVSLQLLKPAGRRQGATAAGPAAVQVEVSAAVRADVYSVDKLGWEPVMDPWGLQVSVCLSPSGPAGSTASNSRITATISSSDLMELTLSPSCIIACKQLQALAAAAKTWQGEGALTQQLLQHLAAPAAGSTLSSAGASCWLVNETGAPLSYVVADAVMEPGLATVALGTCGPSSTAAGSSSRSSSPIKPLPPSGAAARLGSSARGQAAHLVPVPLRVLDVAAAGYFGRFVDQGGVSSSDFNLQQQQQNQQQSQQTSYLSTGRAAAAKGPAVRGAGVGIGSGGVRQSQLLYVQAAGRVDVVGPVALSQMGVSVHPLRAAAAAAGALSPGSGGGAGAGGGAIRRPKPASSLVVEVSRHRYGGRLVSVHSNIQLVNSSGLTLQLGYWPPLGVSAQPLLLATLAPGDAVWLPLQVLQTTTPSLCLRPAALQCRYSWCRALDVYALLPESSSSSTGTSGFWYEPAAAAPRATSQFLTFAPQTDASELNAGPSSSTSPGPAGAGAAAEAAAAAAAAVGSLVLAMGASARPWPAGVSVHDTLSSGTSHGGSVYSKSRAAGGTGGSTGQYSAASTLWQVVVEPPAVLVNQLPVAVEVSVVAGKGEVRGLAALLDSRQQLPLYGCEPAYYSKLRVQVPGFHSSNWIPLNAAASSAGQRAAGRPGSDTGAAAARHSSSSVARDASGAAAAAAVGGRFSDAGGHPHTAADPGGASPAAVPEAMQLLEQQQVMLAGLQMHQPPQALQLRTCRNKLTGCLTVSLSCSLWIFNCLGSQVAIRQAGAVAGEGPGSSVSADPLLAAAVAPLAPSSPAGTYSTSVTYSSGSSSSQVLWLPPYPWMSSKSGSGSSSDLAGLGAAAAAASTHGPPSLASAWAAAQRSDAASAGGRSQSALQRSRSTPSLLASTAGLEFLAVTPARGGTAARSAALNSSRQYGQVPQLDRRGSRGGSEHMGLSHAAWDATHASASVAGPVPQASPFAAAATAFAHQPAGLGLGAGLAEQQDRDHQQQQQQQQRLSVRRSFSASAAHMRTSSPQGSHGIGADGTAQFLDDEMQQHEELTTDQQQQQQGAGAGPGLPRPARTRRHSSGLHMLASGMLPQQLLPQLQLPDASTAQPAGCSSFDLLSPTHQQQLLQQMQLQQAAAAAAVSEATGTAVHLAQFASTSDLANAPLEACQAVVLPLSKPDMTGWLPLLAGGDLNQLTAAAAAFAGPLAYASDPSGLLLGQNYAVVGPQAAMQQRVAAAAAAADQLLSEMPSGHHHHHHQQLQQQQHHGVSFSLAQQPEQVAHRQLGSPPSSVSQFAASSHVDSLAREASLQSGGPAGSYSGSYSHHSHYSISAQGVTGGPGLAGLAPAHQHAAGPGFTHQGLARRPSWSGAGFADLAAAAAASSVGGASTDGGHHGGFGPLGAGMQGASHGYAVSYRSAAVVDAVSSVSSAAATAAPIMCGWAVQQYTGSSTAASSSGSSARVGAAASTPAAAARNACGFIELQLCAAPAALAAAVMGKGVQQLPSQWSPTARVPLLALDSMPGPCSIVKLPLSLPQNPAAAASHPAGAAGAAAMGPTGAGTSGSELAGTAARRRSTARGRAAGGPGQHEAGACFVSVHTAAVPGGGGAWAVHLLPTYLLVNTLSTEVQLRQVDSELVLQSVPPGGHCCVLWPNAALPLRLQFRVDEPGWSWSGAASVDAPGEFLVKIRHRSRGETLLLQLDVAASSSGIVATLSGRQGGFAPYRIDNCSAEVLHVQQAGCAEQEDVLRPYSSLPYAWDEPSMPHKVLLFLRGHRPLGEFALERVGQARRVAIPSSSRDHLSRSHAKRLLLITTYAEGPMRVLRVLDTQSHLLREPALTATASAQALAAAVGGLEGFSSRGSFASITEASALAAYGSSPRLSQQQQQQQSLSRPSSTSSLQGLASSGSQSGSSQASAAAAATAATAAGASQQLGARNSMLRLLSAFLTPPDSITQAPADALPVAGRSPSPSSSTAGGSSSSRTAGGALKIRAPSLDVRLCLSGCGLSLVSDSRELLYSSVRGVRLRFAQDALCNAVGAAIGSMRVENTLYGCQYPLMLASPVSRSVFGVLYPQGPTWPGGAPALAAAAAANAGGVSTPGGGAPGQSAGSSSSQQAAAVVAEGSTPSDLADGDDLSVHSASQLGTQAVQQQQQDQQQPVSGTQGTTQQAPASPAAAAASARVVNRSSSSSAMLRLQQALQQQQQQTQAPLQVLQPQHLALGVLASVWRTQPSGVVCVEQLGLQLSPLTLSLEGKHLKQLAEFGAQVAAAAAGANDRPSSLVAVAGRQHIVGLGSSGRGDTWFSSAAASGRTVQQNLPPVQPPSLPATATAASRRLKLYFEEWFISAITLCISFAPGSWFDPSPAGLSSAWSSASGAAAAATAAAEAAAVAAAAAAAAQAPAGTDTAGEAGSSSADAAEAGTSSSGGLYSTDGTTAAGSSTRSALGAASSGGDQGDGSSTAHEQDSAAGAADVGAAAAAVAAASSSPLPVYLQMALALAHAEEGAWLTLAPFSSAHTMINTESLIQVLGRHYILAAYQELPKVLASLDIFGDPARLLQALGLGFWNLVTLPAHSARWGPHRSLQRLLRGMRVMAYGVSNSIAKGSKRSKAALLPLAPDGLSWQQQQQQQHHHHLSSSSRGSSSSLALHRPGLETGSLAALRSGSLAAAEAAAGGSNGSNGQPGGQDLLHVLVAGYSLAFQALLRSFQSGQPLRGVVRAAAQTLVLPALLLLEMSESTASSFVRLLAEQVPGAVALRVPRYVATGQLLRPYDRLESLGRALLHHTPCPFLREEFLGCVELQRGLFAVVTVGHLLLLACRVMPAAAAAGSATSGSSTGSKGPASGQQQSGPHSSSLQQQQTEAKQEPRQPGATAVQQPQQTSQQQPEQQQQQGQSSCVQYKDPQLVFVLDLRDVMMVAAEGSSLRLLCMAGDPAMGSVAVGDSTPRHSAAGGSAGVAAPGGPDDGSNGSNSDDAGGAATAADSNGSDGRGVSSGVLAGSKAGRGDGVVSGSGLRELLTVAGLGGRSGAGVKRPAGPSVPTAAVGAGVQAGVEGRSRWQTAGSAVSFTDAELESAAAGAAAAVAAAVGGGVMGRADAVDRAVSGTGVVDTGGASSTAAQQGAWAGCKWFVGHQVPCGSEQAALQLQQLLERACQRVETLLASSAWPRQLML